MRTAVRIIAHRNASGNLSLRLRCLIQSRYCDIATGITLSPSEWDNRRQRILSAHPDSKALNARLDTLIDRAALYLAHSDAPTADAVRAALRDLPRTADRYTSDDLYDALHTFIDTESRHNTWSDGTIRRFQSLTASLTAFAPVLHLSTLTAATLDRYIDFRASQEFNNTTITRDIKLLRWFLRWAHTNGRYHGDLHDTYTPHLRGGNFEFKEVIYLTVDELTAIETAPLPDSLAAVRDIFCLCCYTGLRFGDAVKLRRCDIHADHIEIVTKKTDKRLRIELNRHSSAILDRLASPDTPPSALALPAVSNQYANILLKEIGQRCGIDEPVTVVKYSGRRRIESTLPKYALLTTHCARRTFVVTALQLGIPLEVISRWTGHSDLKALKPYIAIVDELKARSMALFDGI